MPLPPLLLWYFKRFPTKCCDFMKMMWTLLPTFWISQSSLTMQTCGFGSRVDIFFPFFCGKDHFGDQPTLRVFKYSYFPLVVQLLMEVVVCVLNLCGLLDLPHLASHCVTSKLFLIQGSTVHYVSSERASMPPTEWVLNCLFLIQGSAVYCVSS